MSELAALFVLLVQAPPPVPSQAVLTHRIDSLTRLYRAAVLRDRGHPVRWPSDTIVAGALRVAIASADTAGFRPVAEQVAGEWRLLMGPDAPAVAITVFGGGEGRLVRAGWLRGPADTATGTGLSELGSGRAAAGWYLGLWEALGTSLYLGADSTLRVWLPADLRPVAGLQDDDALAYQWAVASGPASRACRSGRLGQCSTALGLDGGRGREFTTTIRGAVLQEALARAGPGAWPRLLRTAGRPLPERLQAVSGLAVPDLVREWRAALGARRHRAGMEDAVRWGLGALWLAVIGMATLIVRRR